MAASHNPKISWLDKIVSFGFEVSGETVNVGPQWNGCRELAKIARNSISEIKRFRPEIRSMSIQSLKQSLPELSDAAFEKVYRQFFIRAHATLLGYEVSRLTGLAQGEGWDEILACFDAERERRYRRRAVATDARPAAADSSSL
jgi:hypothetical protein